MTGHDPDLAPDGRKFTVTLTPAVASWPVYAAMLAFAVVAMLAGLFSMHEMPESPEWLQMLVFFGGAFVGGSIVAIAVACGGWALAEAVQKRRRHIADGVAPVTVSAAGLHLPQWGLVPWHEVGITRDYGEEGEPTGSWHLSLHRGRDCRLSAAGDDSDSLDALTKSIVDHTTRCAARRNADGSPRVIHAWRIRQSVLDVFRLAPRALSVAVIVASLVFTSRDVVAGLMAGTLFCFALWTLWLFAITPAFMALTGYERDRLFFIEDGRLLDEHRRPLLSLADTGWSLDEQHHVLKETRPVLNFWHGRRKRLELVVHERTPGDGQQALLHALRTRYAHQQIPAPVRH